MSTRQRKNGAPSVAAGRLSLCSEHILRVLRHVGPRLRPSADRPRLRRPAPAVVHDDRGRSPQPPAAPILAAVVRRRGDAARVVRLQRVRPAHLRPPTARRPGRTRCRDQGCVVLFILVFFQFKFI